MRQGKLAVNGGKPVREQPFPAYNTIGSAEKAAVNRVLDSGVLSEFVGVWGEYFNGGSQVRELEKEWADWFGVKHAVSMNSATSALYAAAGALDVGPGDEVIVSPYTMTASAIAPLVYGAVPVFADIDPEIYCVSAKSVAERITERTKAIIAVDIFGHPADFQELQKIADEKGIRIIEDAAQAPAAKYEGRFAGTLGDIGVFSLNYHKTIHCGEGGIAVTDDDDLADRLRLIRNHAETVVKDHGGADLNHLLGFNYRMTEIEAAIAREQLRKLDGLTTPRIENAEFLRSRWGKLEPIQPPVIRDRCVHAFYVFSCQYDASVSGVSRSRFLEAVKAEGVPLIPAYVEPLYRQPIYQQRAMRSGPNSRDYEGDVSYDPATCPITEEMHQEKLFYTPLIHSQLSGEDMEHVALAVEKVVDNLDQLK